MRLPLVERCPHALTVALALGLLAALTPASTASTGPRASASEAAVLTPIPAGRLSQGRLTSADGRRAADVLIDTDRYLLRTWWPRTAPVLLGQVSRAPAAVSARQDEIRRLGMAALSLAVSLRTGHYDPARVGVPRVQATAAAVRIVAVVSAQHLANRTEGWGARGQSALWSSFTARAGWLLWEDLPPATRRHVTSMLIREADVAMQTDPLYLRDRVGQVIRPGNSAAEENSWNALPLQLATATLPKHPHWAAWRHAQVQLMLSSWARPQDVNQSTDVNGAPYGVWVNGSNVEANGAVINHKRIAPDYSTTLYQNVDGILMDALAGTATPEATLSGLAPVYAGLTTTRFTGRGYLSPGGTVYQPSGIYYPQGCDWGTGQYLPYALVDAQAAAFGFGGRTAPRHELAHLRRQQQLQQRFPDRRTFATDLEYKYAGREEHTAQLAAQLYLTKVVRDRDLARFTSESFFEPAARGRTGLPVLPAVSFTES